jgi:hypothetical protein
MMDSAGLQNSDDPATVVRIPRLTGIVSGIAFHSEIDGRRASVQNDSREALAQR